MLCVCLFNRERERKLNNMVFIGFGAINGGAKNNAEQKGVIEEDAVCTQNPNNTRKGAERGGAQ